MNDAQKGFLEKNALSIFGETNRNTLEYVQEAVSHHLLKYFDKCPQLTVFISSNGGNYGVEIYDVLTLYPGKITGVVVNMARSAAMTILQACDMRYATPHSRLLIHHGRTADIPYDDIIDDERVKTVIHNLRVTVEKKYELYMARTGLTRESIRELCGADRDMLVDEAMKLGFIDGIWTSSLPVSPDGFKWD